MNNIRKEKILDFKFHKNEADWETDPQTMKIETNKYK
jgi:hypothetical protein